MSSVEGGTRAYTVWRKLRLVMPTLVAPLSGSFWLNRGSGQRGRLSGGVGLHLGRHAIPDFSLGNCQHISGLEVEPEAGAVAEKTSEPKCGLRRNAAFAVQDVGDPAGWQPQRQCKTIGRKVAREPKTTACVTPRARGALVLLQPVEDILPVDAFIHTTISDTKMADTVKRAGQFNSGPLRRHGWGLSRPSTRRGRSPRRGCPAQSPDLIRGRA